MQQSPNQARLYYLRAREAEAQLDFAAAEKDWVEYVRVSTDKAAAWLEKADYHHRRLENDAEIAALLEAGKLSPTAEPFLRAQKLVQEQLLPSANQVYLAWQQRFPQDVIAYESHRQQLLKQKDWSGYEALLARYAAAFPAQVTSLVRMRADLESARTSRAAALAFYAKSLQPDWPRRTVSRLLR